MKLTLNLASGNRVFDEYPKGYRCINLDFRKDLKRVDVVSDVRKIPFANGALDYVLASDIIDHFTLKHTKSLLLEWRRVLKENCIMEIRAPNFNYLADHYVRSRDTKFTSRRIFGRQDYPENFHYVIFNGPWLSKIGLAKVDYSEEDTNFTLKVRRL